MSQIIGQVWREVVGCRNWTVMRVPLFIALRRNGHHVILVASIAVAPTPGRESAPVFCGKQSVVIKPHQSGVIAWRPWQPRRYVVCLIAEFLLHTVISNENGEFYTYGIYPYLNRSVCLLVGSPTWWRFSFCSSGSSLVCFMMTWRTRLVHEFQMWGRRCKHLDSRWFQGVKCVSVESNQPCYDNISWFIQFD